MRWLILALSLGTTLATLWRGIWLFISGLTEKTGSSASFWWAMVLCVGSLLGFIGGVLAFNHKMISLIFLLAAAMITFFVRFFGHSSYVFVYSFAVISILTFIYLSMRLRSRSRMGYYGFNVEMFGEENSYGEAEDDEDDDEQETASVQAMKIPKRRSSHSASQDSDSLIIKPSQRQRQRENKVCLSCGVDIPISYKFCPSCGTELHAPHSGKLEDTAEESEKTFKVMEVKTDSTKDDIKYRAKYNIINVIDEDESKEDDLEINENIISDKSEEVEVVPVVRKTSSEETEEIQENDDVPFKPLNVQPKKQRKFEADSSYQSFGRYTQSRKRRKVSIFQRALLSLLVLSLVGSIGLFMYRGISKSSPGRIDTPVPRVSPEITENTTRISDNMDEFELAIPNQIRSLPYMEISPARQVITTGNEVNLRENHTTTSRRITSLPVNNTYPLQGQWKTDDVSSLPQADRNLPGDGIWYRIQAGSNAGWIYGQFALPLDGRATSLPDGYTEALLNSFGSNREEIEERLGNSRQQIRGDTTVLEYTNLRITLHQDRVQDIQITGRGHNLANGLAVGMTFDEMSGIIGAPNRYTARDRALSYLETANRGIVIRRENDGRIRSINVGSITQ